MDCIFCKIIGKEIPAEILYEDERTISFLDLTPINEGHALVVPKNHAETLLDISSADLAACSNVLQHVSLGIMKAVLADAFNIHMNNFEAAGQAVKHAHFHIIPRFRNDGLDHWHGKKASSEALKETAEKIRTFLK